jgi:hypothetical protein
LEKGKKVARGSKPCGQTMRLANHARDVGKQLRLAYPQLAAMRKSHFRSCLGGLAFAARPGRSRRFPPLRHGLRPPCADKDAA